MQIPTYIHNILCIWWVILYGIHHFSLTFFARFSLHFFLRRDVIICRYLAEEFTALCGVIYIYIYTHKTFPITLAWLTCHESYRCYCRYYIGTRRVKRERERDEKNLKYYTRRAKFDRITNRARPLLHEKFSHTMSRL